jgi:2',3'-cyclic-nucleotide 2'-phosphodiesterase (5'-nucleotidase family)
MHRNRIMVLVGTALLATSCASHYQLAGVERSRILIDSTYDAHPDEQAAAFMAPFKHRVDSMMSPVVGSVARYMAAVRPESPLSNLMADILLWTGKAYQEHPDFAVYNMGGMRAAFSKGPVTYGDVLDVAPFENKICFLTLKGDKVLELFREMASVGGEAVSHGVNLVITKDYKLKSASLNGKPIDPQADYRVATLDYLAQGNDKMVAFKAKTNVVSPQNTENNVRFLIINYFREQTAQGKVVDREVEGRIVVE